MSEGAGGAAEVVAVPAVVGRMTLVSAFFRLSAREAWIYPVSLIMKHGNTLLLIVPFYFLSQFLVQDSSYFAFLIVGVLIQGLLNTPVADLGSATQGLIQRGQLEFILTQPIRWSQLPLALSAWPLAMRLQQSVLILIWIVLARVDFMMNDPLLVFGLVAAGFAAMSAIGVLGMALRLISKRRDPVTTGLQFGMWVFSGVYFPVNALPGWMQPFSLAFPQAYAIDGVRQLVVPGAEQAMYAPTTLFWSLVVYALIGLPIAFTVYRWSFATVRRQGGVGSY